jgi:hypothetical protein
MDTQGYELHIIKGACDCLKCFKPIIFMEFWPYSYNQTQGNFEHFNWLITENNYDIFDIPLNTSNKIKITLDQVYTFYKTSLTHDIHKNLLLTKKENI